jgi:hypothetical protein
MKSASLVTAASIILVANALALIHSARNRAGSPEAEITLTNRELRYFDQSATDDDSGVTLHLQWTDPASFPVRAGTERKQSWLDRTKLQTLGFDCAVDPGNSEAARFYERQRPRQVFAALEYDSAAWRALVEEFERARAKQQADAGSNDSTAAAGMSRLVAIDADLNPVRLRARHPDRRTVLILPAVIAVMLDRWPYYGMKPESEHPPQIAGRIQELPSSIHVPRPFSDQFRRPDRSQPKVFINPIYSVRPSLA